VHNSWQDATEVHTLKLVKEYYDRKKSIVQMAEIKGEDVQLSRASPNPHICTINMSNGSLLPASTFSFQYPAMDCEETPTTGTTNDYQYDDQVVLFGTGQQSVRTNPSLMDFNPLRVNITMCNPWFKPEAIYCNNTWWETLQDDGSKMSKLGSSDVPG
jgi:hypothetical protein